MPWRCRGYGSPLEWRVRSLDREVGQGAGMRRKTWIVAVMALLLLLIVVGCTSERKTTSSPATATPTTKTPATATPTTAAATPEVAAASVPAAATSPPPAAAVAPTTTTAAAPPEVAAASAPTGTASAPPAATAAATSTAAASAPAAPAALPPTVPIVPSTSAPTGATPTESVPTPTPEGSATLAPMEPSQAPALSQPVVVTPITSEPAVPTTVATPTTASAPAASALVAPLVLPEGAEVELEAAAQALDDLFAESADVLAGLGSYRYTTTFSFTTKEGGEPESGSIEVHGTVASAERQSLTWRDLETGEEFALTRVGARTWIRKGEEWTEVPAMVADALSQGILVFSPMMGWGAFAEGLQASSNYVGSETVNGSAARHYTSTYSEWSESWSADVTDAKGDVWIAEAGYPVRYRLTANSLDEEGNRGTILWTMELSDVNGSITIDAPQGVGEAAPVAP